MFIGAELLLLPEAAEPGADEVAEVAEVACPPGVCTCTEDDMLALVSG